MTATTELASQGLRDLLAEAWALRCRHFPDRIDLAAPGARRYDTACFQNHPHSFVHVSVTGTACALRCEHCRGRLLEAMLPAPTPGDLRRLGRTLHGQGTQGVLVSGGADQAGQVPLLPFAGALAELKGMGLKVIVHCGLADRATARGLKEAGVDQVLLDIIGDAETSRAIYHLDRAPADYRRALETLKEEGLALAPHVVIGLHRGRLRGEYQALREIAAVGVERIVLVILTPMAGTPLEDSAAPPPDDAARVMAAARLLCRTTPLSLGCARPAGAQKIEYERLAVDAGINAIAFPTEQTVAYARERGLEPVFHELCCSL